MYKDTDTVNKFVYTGCCFNFLDQTKHYAPWHKIKQSEGILPDKRHYELMFFEQISICDLQFQLFTENLTKESYTFLCRQLRTNLNTLELSCHSCPHTFKSTHGPVIKVFAQWTRTLEFNSQGCWTQLKISTSHQEGKVPCIKLKSCQWLSRLLSTKLIITTTVIMLDTKRSFLFLSKVPILQ